MRRLLVLLLLTTSPVFAQSRPGPFAANIERAKGLMQSYATADLPATCSPGKTVYDSTTQALTVCQNNGTSWVAPGGGDITGGTTVVASCGDGRVLYDNSGVVGCGADFLWDDTANASFLKLGAGTAPGAVRLLEGSGGGTNYGVLTVPATLGGDRTYTFPDASVTVSGSASALTSGRIPLVTTGGLLVDDTEHTWSATQIAIGGTSINVALGNSGGVAQIMGTGSHMYLGTGGLNYGRIGTDAHVGVLGTSQVAWTSGNITTSVDTGLERVSAKWVGATDGSTGDGGFVAPLGVQGAQTKALTESTPTAFVRISVAQGSFVGGTIEYTIHADDGTDFQARSGIWRFAAVNKAGAETCSIVAPIAGVYLEEAVAVSTGTLVHEDGFTCSTASADTIDIFSDVISSLTQTTLAIKYRVLISSGTATVTPQ